MGAWFRCTLAFSRTFGLIAIYMGHLLCAIAGVKSVVHSYLQVFIVGATPLVAAVWFGPKERIVATSVGFALNTIGMGATFLTTPEITHGIVK